MVPLRIFEGIGDGLNPLFLSPSHGSDRRNNGGTVGVMWEVAHAAGTNAVILHRLTGGSGSRRAFSSDAECGLTRSAALSLCSCSHGSFSSYGRVGILEPAPRKRALTENSTPQKLLLKFQLVPRPLLFRPPAFIFVL